MRQESGLAERITRIDENVKTLLETLPMIRRHDRELFTLKIIIGSISPILMFWIAHQLGIQIF